MKTLRSLVRSSSPTVVAVGAALAICSVGSAVAAATITGAQIKNNTVASVDVKNNSLASADIKNGGLAVVDLAPSARAALKGNTGPAGPAGPAGVNGTGAPGARGASAWDDIPTGTTVTGSFFERRPNDLAGSSGLVVPLPGRLAAPIGAGNINFAPSTAGADDDATCTGTVSAPTAPAGKICIYPSSTTGVQAASAGGYADILARSGFRVLWTATAINQSFSGTWAYTAA